MLKRDKISFLWVLSLFYLLNNENISACGSLENKEIPIILHQNYPKEELIICQITNIELTTSSDFNYDYQWQLNGFDIINATNSVHWTDKAGSYTVKKKSKSNNQTFISETFTIILKLNLDPIKIDYAVKTYCENDKAVLKIKAPYKYGVWSSTTQNLGLNESIEVSNSGTYFVQYGGENGCPVVKDNITLNFNPLPENPSSGTAQFFTCKSDDFELIIPQKSNYTYEWYKNNVEVLSGNKSSLKTTDFGVYNVKIIDNTTACNIFSNDFILSEDPNCYTNEFNVYIPNSFSPNNDGINDKWEIKNINIFKDCEVKIYNRWGNIIYFQTGEFESWDGKVNDTNVISGTYFYEIKLKNSVNSILTGQLYVLY